MGHQTSGTVQLVNSAGSRVQSGGSVQLENPAGGRGPQKVIWGCGRAPAVGIGPASSQRFPYSWKESLTGRLPDVGRVQLGGTPQSQVPTLGQEVGRACGGSRNQQGEKGRAEAALDSAAG